MTKSQVGGGAGWSDQVPGGGGGVTKSQVGGGGVTKSQGGERGRCSDLVTGGGAGWLTIDVAHLLPPNITE